MLTTEITDRELLELAAKAAGYRTDHPWNTERLDIDPPLDALMLHNADGGLVHTAWNPLTDDSDALRLAVKLFITVEHPDPADLGGGYVTTKLCERRHRYRFLKEYWFNEPFDGDPYAATRRAIVRAAAEIGRTMQ